MSILEEVLSAVQDETVRESIVGLVNAEREKGITKYRKRDGEILKYKAAMKSLGYDSDEYENVEDFVSKKKEVNTRGNLTIAQLNEKVDQLTTDLSAQRMKVEEERKTAEKLKIETKLSGVLDKQFYGSKWLLNDLISNNKVRMEGDNVVFVNGDEIIPMNTGLQHLADENKDSLKANVSTGSGDNGGVSMPPTTTEELSFADKMAKVLSK